MNFWNKSKYWFISIVILAFVGWSAFKNELKDVRGDISALSNFNADIQVEGVSFIRNSQAGQVFHLTSKNATLLEMGKKMELEQVLADINAANGKIWKVSAQKGHYEMDKKLELTSDVVVTFPDQKKLFASQIEYDQQGKKVSSQLPVKLVSDDLILTGKGFQYDIDTGRLFITNQSSTIFQTGKLF